MEGDSVRDIRFFRRKEDVRKELLFMEGAIADVDHERTGKPELREERLRKLGELGMGKRDSDDS